MNKFSKILREARIAKGLKQEDVAKLVGKSKNVVSNWERGDNKPDIDTVEILCRELDINPNQIIDIGNKKNPLTDGRQGELMQVLDNMGFITEDGDLSEHGRKIITDLIRNNADMLKKLYSDD